MSRFTLQEQNEEDDAALLFHKTDQQAQLLTLGSVFGLVFAAT
jgi:hypothetical protein